MRAFLFACLYVCALCCGQAEARYLIHATGTGSQDFAVESTSCLDVKVAYYWQVTQHDIQAGLPNASTKYVVGCSGATVAVGSTITVSIAGTQYVQTVQSIIPADTGDMAGALCTLAAPCYMAPGAATAGAWVQAFPVTFDAQVIATPLVQANINSVFVGNSLWLVAALLLFAVGMVAGRLR